MTKRAINDVQSFLTYVETDGDRTYQIVNVCLLLRRHPPEAVITFLQELQKDYGKALSKLIQEDKTNSQINELVAKRFRVKMAIIPFVTMERIRRRHERVESKAA